MREQDLSPVFVRKVERNTNRNRFGVHSIFLLLQALLDRVHMGSHWQDGSLCWPCKQRINHSDPWDWPNCPNGILLSHWHLFSQSCETTRFQTSGYVTIPSENFSLVGYKKDSIRKGERWFSLRARHPLFPLINFLFLPDCPACSLFLCPRLIASCTFFLLSSVPPTRLE